MRKMYIAFSLTLLALPLACSSSVTPAKDGGAGKGGSGGTGGKAGTSGPLAGAGGDDGGMAGTGNDAAAGSDAGPGDATDAPVVLTAEQSRGQYLVNSVLGCSGCHTPQKAGGGGPDMTKFLAGNDCFAKDS